MIERYENLPMRLSMKKAHTKGWGIMHYRSDYHRVNGYYPYTTALRVVENNIGKSFDLAFSYFCKLVPVYQQKEFLEMFLEKHYGLRYIVDDNGNIQCNKEKNKYSGPFYVKSSDYKEIWVKKKEYLLQSEENALKHPHSLWRFLPKEFESLSHIFFQERHKYEVKIVSGTILEFSSRKDRTFKRLKAEKRKKDRKQSRLSEIERSKKLYSFLTKEEQQIINDRDVDIIKRDSHGFDDMSFKNRKQ